MPFWFRAERPRRGAGHGLDRAPKGRIPPLHHAPDFHIANVAGAALVAKVLKNKSIARENRALAVM